MKITVPKDVLLLSIGFLLIFTGFNGVQQFVTTYFSQIGFPSVGFQSLILVYLFFTLSDPLSAILVSKFGAKKTMIIGSIFYASYILMLTTKSTILVYGASILLGMAAALLWTGQNSYLVRATSANSRGSNAGLFGTLLFGGSAVGVTLLGFLVNKFSYQWSFLLAAGLPIIGIFFL